MVEAHYAVPLAGGVLVAINRRLAAPEIDLILATPARRCCSSTRRSSPHSRARPVRAQVVRIEDTPRGDDPYEQSARLAARPESSLRHEAEEDTLTINYTSGTTGGAKGVMGSHRGSYLQALAMAIEAGIGAESVFLQVVPTFHANGWAFPWACVAVGAAQVCLRKPDPAAMWAAIARRA